MTDWICERHDMGLQRRPCTCPAIARKGPVQPVKLVSRGPFVAIDKGVVVATVARPSMDQQVDADIRNAERFILMSNEWALWLCDMARQRAATRETNLAEVFELLDTIQDTLEL